MEGACRKRASWENTPLRPGLGSSCAPILPCGKAPALGALLSMGMEGPSCPGSPSVPRWSWGGRWCGMPSRRGRSSCHQRSAGCQDSSIPHPLPKSTKHAYSATIAMENDGKTVIKEIMRLERHSSNCFQDNDRVKRPGVCQSRTPRPTRCLP